MNMIILDTNKIINIINCSYNAFKSSELAIAIIFSSIKETIINAAVWKSEVNVKIIKLNIPFIFFVRNHGGFSVFI